MNIGFFTKQDGALIGNLPTLGFRDVSLECIRKAGNGPNYAVTVEGAELGVAWDKTAGTNGRAYISAKLMVPGQEPFYIAIFQNEKEGNYVAVYNEPRKQRTEETGSVA